MEWRHKHLLGLEDLTREEILFILDTAEKFKEVSTRSVKTCVPGSSAMP